MTCPRRALPLTRFWHDAKATGPARTGLARTYNLEGINLSNAGELQRAAFAFKRAADLDPAWSAPCVNMGVVLGRLGKPSKAISAYHAALRRDPHNPVAYYNMGSAHHELGELPKAVRAVETLLSICPRYPQARLALANTLIDLGQHDRAIALLLEEIDRRRRRCRCGPASGWRTSAAATPTAASNACSVHSPSTPSISMPTTTSRCSTRRRSAISRPMRYFDGPSRSIHSGPASCEARICWD